MKIKVASLFTVVIIFCPFLLWAQIITTVVGGGTDNNDSIPALSAHISHPSDIVFDKFGNLYINSGLGHKVHKVDVNGIITVIAGTGSSGYNGDGGLADTSELNNPGGICVDSIGNVFIADNGNFRVRKVDVTTGLITTVAGIGVDGYNGEGIPATTAQLTYLADVYFDHSGNLYIGEIGNNPRIRKVTSSGMISTYVGTGVSGYSGDGGQATQAQISLLAEITTDSVDNLYFSDYGSNANCIRKVDKLTGIITTVAGTTNGVYNGDNIPATSANITPLGLEIDHSGNLYFADWYNNRMRKIDANGLIHTIAGDGIMAYSGDGGLAILSQLNRPADVTFDTCGNLFLSETTVGRVRKITYNDSCGQLSIKAKSAKITKLDIYPNPVSATISMKSGTRINEAVLTNAIGQVILKQRLNKEHAEMDVQHLQPGIYFLTVTDDNGIKLTKKIIKE